MYRGIVTALGLLSGVLACQPSAAPAPPASPPPAPAATETAIETNAPRPEFGSFGLDLSGRQPATGWGDDFYVAMNGAWLDTYQLKADEMRFGPFIKLKYRAEDQVKAIIDELAQTTPAPGSLAQQIGDYYASFMDQASLNAKGIEPLRADLKAIADIQTRAQLVEAFGRSSLTGTEAPIASFVAFDRKDPDRHQLNLVHSGLGLPTRDYYLEKSFAAQLAAYQDNVAKLLALSGLGEVQAKAAAEQVLNLEVAIAKVHWPIAELRDRDKTLNNRTIEQLEQEVPGYAWREHLKAAGFDAASIKDVNVYTPDALAPLAAIVKKTAIGTWKHYLSYHLIKSHAALLGDAVDQAAFEFYGKVLNGQPEQRERWKRGIELVSAHESFGEGVGKLYVERHFPPESKQQMDVMVENLRAALKARIEKLDWMSDATKQEAFKKLEAFNPKIGYPNKWRDFSGIRIKKDDLLGNYKAVRKYWHDDEVGRLGRATDKDEWFMSPHEINAYYNPAFNEIVFPAAILQPPFFDPHADPAVNYGAIGAVIGHEMGHGFDDQGSKSDYRGVQRDWWTEEDRKRFNDRTQALVEQYDQYEPLPGHKLNGKLTLGENIGDLGGLSMALEAYQASLAGQQAPVIEGYSGLQRFFLSWAQLWRSKTRDEFLLRVIKSDPHSPGEFRVNGVVRNLDAWYTAFNVQPDARLFLAPDKRVSIW